jgi:hypothetical protein
VSVRRTVRRRTCAGYLWGSVNPSATGFLRKTGIIARQIVKKAERRVKVWTKPVTDSLIGGTAADLLKSKQELIAENALLRQQLIVLKRHVKQPTLPPTERGLLVTRGLFDTILGKLPASCHPSIATKPGRPFWPITPPKSGPVTLCRPTTCSFEPSSWFSSSNTVRDELSMSASRVHLPMSGWPNNWATLRPLASIQST